MPEDRPTISSSRLTAVDVARHTFATSRRGFDPADVRSYLELVARELGAAEQREQELREALADAEQRSLNPVIDESKLSAALGQQSAQVLRHAYEEAARITQAAEESSAARLHEAQQQAGEIQAQAEGAAAERIADAELGITTVQHQARVEAEEKLASALAQSEELAAEARAEADRLVAQARSRGLRMLEQAKEERRRVLTDLSHRRRAVMVQIEQFRAARDELATAVLGVRDTFDTIVDNLERADEDARAAAAQVAREARYVAAETEIPDVDITDLDESELDHGQEAPPTGEVVLDPDAEPVTADPAALEEASGLPAEDVDVAAPDAAAPDVSAPEAAVPADGVLDAVAPHVEEAGAEADTQSVEALFARIRASGTTATSPPEVADPPPAPAAAPTAGAPVVEVLDEADEAEVDEVAEVVEIEVDEVVEVPEGDALLLLQRADLLDPVVGRLARKLKRTLQDDQNRLLDRIRSGKGPWVDLLPDAAEHQELFVAASRPILKEAAVAGSAFVAEVAPSTTSTANVDKIAAAIAEQLGATVAGALRRRLIGSSDEPEVAEGDEAERVGAAYREWRGERVETLVGDAALGAFSAGVLGSTDPGGQVRWVLATPGEGCADCDDNALAEGSTPGDEFPTGHRHPPAHAGCRCLLAPNLG